MVIATSNGIRRLHMMAGLAGLMACVSCDSSNTTKPPINSVPTHFVDAAAGNDANTGTSASPFRTITHALSLSTSGHFVRIAPGTYDTALGEVFPIVVPPGVTLMGDTVGRGAALPATLIEGTGATGILTIAAALVASTGATISGLTISNGIGAGANVGIFANESNVRVSDNTFTLSACGVYVDLSGAALVRNCSFETPEYGVLSRGSITIQDNEFTSGLYGVDNHAGNPLIRRNTFTAGGSFGVMVQGGSPSIVDNNFTASGFANGAVLAMIDSSPVLRGNTFTLTNGPAVRVQQTAAPDLGTTVSPGNNVFDVTNGADVSQGSSTAIIAIGNTWSQTPPMCGTNITGTGYLLWGTGTGEECLGEPASPQ